MSTMRSLLPASFKEVGKAYTQGFPDGFRAIGRTVVANFKDRKLTLWRLLINGLLAAGTSYFLSTDKKLGGNDQLESGAAIGRASLLGGINFLGSMVLAAPAKAGFINWLRSEWTYGAVLPLADLIGSFAPKYLLENDENHGSVTRVTGCFLTIGAMTAFYMRFMYNKLTSGNTAQPKFALGYSVLIGALHLVQSWWFAKKQTEHSGNPHLDIGRFTVVEVGTAVAQLLPLSLIPKTPAAITLWAPITMATSVLVSLRELPSRGFGMTHFYAKLQDYNWENAQLLNGARVLALGLLLPTYQLSVVTLQRSIGWLFIAGQALSMFLSASYWTLLDRTRGMRVLAGKGQWQKKDSPVMKLFETVKADPSPENCDKLHGQMLHDMGSFDPFSGQLMPDRVDFQHHDTFLPNRKFTSLEDWFREIPDGNLHIYRDGLLGCEPVLKRKVRRKEASEGEERLFAYLQPAYGILEGPDENESSFSGCSEKEE